MRISQLRMPRPLPSCFPTLSSPIPGPHMLNGAVVNKQDSIVYTPLLLIALCLFTQGLLHVLMS